jgi:cold shock CspA family protein
MSSESVLTGRVKWFNNKSGFGFVSVVQADDETLIGKDVFAHHTSICVDKEQFRYLVQGEYVSFSIADVDGESAHKIQTSNIRGIGGGYLMCETRFEAKSSETEGEGRNIKWKTGASKRTKKATTNEVESESQV